MSALVPALLIVGVAWLVASTRKPVSSPLTPQHKRILAGMRFSIRGAGDRSNQIFPLIAVEDQNDAAGTVAAMFLDSFGQFQRETVPLSAVVSIEG